MEQKISVCEICGKEATCEKQKRKENWIELNGGSLYGISIWLDKPRKHKEHVADCYMLTVGWQNRVYDFCSIKCLVKALKGKESI